MNQFFTACLALFLTVVLWITGKKTKLGNLIFSKAIANINHLEELSLVTSRSNQNKVKGLSPSNINSKNFIAPKNAYEVKILKSKLFNLMSGSSSERLEAIRIAGQWKDKSVIPFLRRGLKDSNSEIMIKSAEYIENFRGKTIKTNDYESERPPLNVFLMR